MFKKAIVMATIVACFVGTSTGSFAESSGWINPWKFKSHVKKMKRKGMIPASVKCRNSPKAKVTIRPEIKVSWKKNLKKRDWALYMYKGQLDFKPGPPAQWHKWRRAYNKVIRSGAAAYRCSLFYAK